MTTSNPTTVSSGATDTVSSGTTVSNLVVLSGGTVNVLAGGTVSGNLVSSGGSETISNGGAALTETIQGSQTVSSGGSTTGTVVSGGTETLLIGGTASGSKISAFGSLVVSGGVASGAVAGVNGSISVTGGATVGDVISGGTEQVQIFANQVSGVSGSVIKAGGNQYVFEGNVAAATLSSGGSQLIYGGVVSGTTVSSGGTQYLQFASAVAVDDVVLGGGTVSNGGTLLFAEAAGLSAVLSGRVSGSGSIINSGGGTLVLAASVTSSGFSSGFTGMVAIDDGTVELTSAGAAGTGPIVFAGSGSEMLKIDGTMMPVNVISGLVQGDAIDLANVAYSSGVTPTVSGSTVTVSQGGRSYAFSIADAAKDGTFLTARAADGSTLLEDTRSITYVGNGVTSTVSSGVNASGLVVLAGGTLSVLRGGLANATVINSGGAETLSGGSGTADLIAGGTQTVSAGGSASGAVIAAGSQILLSGGTAVATQVSSGGILNVSGGTSVSAFVASGGLETVGVFTGSATAVGTVVASGGKEVASYGGATIASVISSGASQLVYGRTSAAIIGGTQTLYTTGVAVDDTVLSGATVYNSGTLLFTEAAGQVTVSGRLTGSGGITNSGGGTLVLKAATTASGFVSAYTGAVTLLAGTVELTSATAAGTGVIGFGPAPATLRIDGTTMPVNVISGLLEGDAIDLAAAPYSSGVTPVVSGNTVTLATGGVSYALTIANAGSIGRFFTAAAADGSTLLEDTRSVIFVSSGVTSTVSAGATASGLVVLSGGTLTVLSGGTAIGTVISAGGVETVAAGGVSIDELITGGSETIAAGASTTSGTVASGGVLTISGGSASATLVATGGLLAVASGISVSGVISGGSETVGAFAGSATVSGTVLEAYGNETVSGTGTAIGSVISSTAAQVLYGGTVSNTTVYGTQTLGFAASLAVNDAVFSGAIVNNSGTLLFTEPAGSAAVLSGSLFYAGIVENGGGGTLQLAAATASSGSTPGFAGAAVVAGGTLELTSGGSAGSGSIDFVGTGTGVLRIDGTSMPYNAISGLVQGDAIDLAAAPYSAGVTPAVSGTSVTVTEGGVSYSLSIADAAGDGSFFTARAADGSTLLEDTRHPVYVSSGVTSNVSAGATLSGAVVLSGGAIDVLSGGLATASVVSTGGSATISNGGSGSGDMIVGGTEVVVAGGSTSGTVISSGNETLYAGGTATATSVGAGGLLAIDGGVASGAMVASSGSLAVNDGLSVSAVVSGTESVGSIVGSATVSGSVIAAGAYEGVSFGASAFASIISGGGQQVVDNATASGTAVYGSQTVYGSSGIAIDDRVFGGGVVNDGGVLLFTEAAGATTILSGRIFGSGGIVNSGAGTLVLAAAATSGSYVSAYTGLVTLSAGTVELTSATAAGSGAIAFDTPAAATLRIDGTVMPGTTISGLMKGQAIDLAAVTYSSGIMPTVSGDTVTISAGGASYALNITDAPQDGGFFTAQAADGSTLLEDTVSVTYVASGVTSTLSAGVLSGARVLSGGTLDVVSAGVATATTIRTGGAELISAGGSASGDVVSGGTETVAAGGAIGAAVIDAGSAAILIGGSATGTTVSATGVLVISGGAASATTVLSGAAFEVVAGTTTGDTLSGGFETIGKFGVTTGVATATGTTLSGLSTQELEGGALASGSIVNSGATQLVIAGSTVSTVVNSGGSQALEAYGAIATDDLVLSGAVVSNNGQMLFDEAYGSTATLGGRLTGAGSIVNSGGGTLVLSAAVNASGTLSAFAGSVILDGGTVELTSAGAAGTGSIDFSALAFATLRIDGATMPGNTLSGLGRGDVLDLAGTPFAAGEQVALASGNVLTVTPASGAAVTLQLNPAESFAGSYFHLAQETNGAGTVVTLDANPCFCAGTLILTGHGERAVEELAAGDQVMTASGAWAPVVWLGWRRVDLARHPRRAEVQPVRVSAGAFGAGLPRRDLLVSPEHAVFVDGVLVPARHLVGCAGIAVDTALDATTYYHIELPRHDVVFAEGLPCESWLDTGNRAMFENSAVAALAFDERRGAAAAWASEACAPLITGGPALDAIRASRGAAAVQDVALAAVGRHRFAVTPGAGLLRLNTRPGQAPGDQRTLGAAVTAVTLDGEPAVLGGAMFAAGFHAAEAGWIWTDGAALLDFGACPLTRSLVIEVAAVAVAQAA